MLAVGSNRLHDRNKRGWWLLVWWLLPSYLFFGGFGIDFVGDPNTVLRAGHFSAGSIMMFASLPIRFGALSTLTSFSGPRGLVAGDRPSQIRDATRHSGLSAARGKAICIRGRRSPAP
jgi:hypothetical protein